MRVARRCILPSMKETPITRRTVLAGATLIPLAAIRRAEAQTPAAITAPALNPEQRKILDAFIDRIIPKDELGPGAVECGVGDYIDRCLADYLAAEKPLFLEASPIWMYLRSGCRA